LSAPTRRPWRNPWPRIYPAQIALVQTQLNELLALVQLYRALGGGWNE
jgi:outer membrane protein TolC